ncbi:toxin-activating lysine-acyltransferase [Pseudomonas sp. CBC3]|uniref:toxin-activating lysine-acyltransferase n=1 Tax=Pseudomonas sp. CBC3 TaxID=3123318 RepID=UPI0030E7EDEC
MQFNNFEIMAPGLIDEPWIEASALGAITWLWMHSDTHRDAPLHTLPAVLLPAIKHRQFMLGSEAGKPVFYLSWLNLSEESEARYLKNSPLMLSEEDWNSGDRVWIEDWIAPFGHSAAFRRLVQRHLFANVCMRSLHHQGESRGARVKTFKGSNVTREQANAWFAARPMAVAL